MSPSLTPDEWKRFLTTGSTTSPDTEPGLPCRDCGALVAAGEGPIETVTATERERVLPVRSSEPVIRTEEILPFEIQLSQCSRCRARNRAAADLVDEYPSLSRSLGDRWYATLAFEAMLLVPDVIGMDWRSIVKGGQKSVRVAMAHFRPLGGAARWSSLVTPVIRHDATQPTRTRWRHLSEELVDRFRDAYGEMLADLTDGPRIVPPPEGNEFRTALRGCLLCGVGTATAMRNQASFVWGPLRGADPGLLGGQRLPHDIYGYLCPTCARAVASVGPGIGPTGMEKALFAFLEIAPPELAEDKVAEFGRTTVQVSHLRAWCALPAGTPPNVTPWAHVSGLGELAEGLRSAIGAR